MQSTQAHFSSRPMSAGNDPVFRCFQQVIPAHECCVDRIVARPQAMFPSGVTCAIGVTPDIHLYKSRKKSCQRHHIAGF